MYFNDHNPPHFHAKYNEYRAIISIENTMILDGNLPPRVLGLITEWAGIHKAELIENWQLLREKGEFKPIKPLT